MSQLVIENKKQSVTAITTYYDEEGQLHVLFGRQDPRYIDSAGESLKGKIPVGAAKFIGGQVEERFTKDEDLKREKEIKSFISKLPTLDTSVSLLDERVVVNALKEIEEEAGLRIEDYMQEDGRIKLVETLPCEFYDGSIQDLHYINVHLGTLSPEKVRCLKTEMKPLDDVIQLISLPALSLVTNVQNEIILQLENSFNKIKTVFNGFKQEELVKGMAFFDSLLAKCKGDTDKTFEIEAKRQNILDIHHNLKGMDGIDMESLGSDIEIPLFKPTGDVPRDDGDILRDLLDRDFDIRIENPKLSAIRRILRDVAAKHIVGFAGDKSRARTKEDRSIQTESDVNAENALTEKLLALFPDAQIIGEEGVSEDETRMDILNNEGIVFVIDPIDGTREFANGGKRYNTMLSMRVGGETVASWIYFPESDKLYFSEKGRGIFKDDGASVEKMDVVVSPQSTSEIVIMNGAYHKDNYPQLAKNGAATIKLKNAFKDVVESNRIAGFDFLQILQGKVQSLIYAQGKFNDILPWEGFINEIGYTLSDIRGNSYDPTMPRNGVIVSPSKTIQQQIVASI